MNTMFEQVHPEWRDMICDALKAVEPDYLEQLKLTQTWLPGMHSLLAAFSLPLSSTKYVLLGESPYPRFQSANGYAFWDAAVGSLWSQTGLSKAVNRATSLRNIIKMLLHARGDLTCDFSQAAIANLDKSSYLQTANQLFSTLVQQGFLLLNASLVYSDDKVPYHARQWRPFMLSLLNQLAEYNPSLNMILFGRIATQIVGSNHFPSLVAEHPYNITFITNPDVIAFFKPLDLIRVRF